MKIFLAAFLLLSACSTGVVTTCPKLYEYSEEFNQKLIAEVAEMDPDMASVTAIRDYLATRRELAHCQ